MKQLIISIALILFSNFFSFSQDQSIYQKTNHKGDFYFYWGWNWGNFTKSNINFKGSNYDFTLKKVMLHDKPTKFDFNTYFNPAELSTPQYNFRFGYFISNNYNVSIGIDHMKYIINPDQVVKISGDIDGTGTVYDGTYTDDDIVIAYDFL